MNREVATEGDSGNHCPDHLGAGPACSAIWCQNVAEARTLEDRAEAIEWLVEQAREAALHGSDCAGGISLTAALETARILARSITDAGSIKDDADGGPALWSVFTLSPRPRKLAAAPEEAAP